MNYRLCGMNWKLLRVIWPKICLSKVWGGLILSRNILRKFMRISLISILFHWRSIISGITLIWSSMKIISIPIISIWMLVIKCLLLLLNIISISSKVVIIKLLKRLRSCKEMRRRKPRNWKIPRNRKI